VLDSPQREFLGIGAGSTRTSILVRSIQASGGRRPAVKPSAAVINGAALVCRSLPVDLGIPPPAISIGKHDIDRALGEHLPDTGPCVGISGHLEDSGGCCAEASNDSLTE